MPCVVCLVVDARGDFRPRKAAECRRLFNQRRVISFGGKRRERARSDLRNRSRSEALDFEGVLKISQWYRNTELGGYDYRQCADDVGYVLCQRCRRINSAKSGTLKSKYPWSVL